MRVSSETDERDLMGMVSREHAVSVSEQLAHAWTGRWRKPSFSVGSSTSFWKNRSTDMADSHEKPTSQQFPIGTKLPRMSQTRGIRG